MTHCFYKRSWCALLVWVSLCCGNSALAKTTSSSLTLDDAREIAIARNLDLMVARMERKLQSQLGRRARRPFVPIVSFDLTYDDDAPLVEINPRLRRVRYGAGLQWLLTSGTQVGLRAQGIEVLAGGGTLVTPSSVVSLSLTQPLLRNAWGRGNTLPAADLERRRQKALFIQQLNALIVRVDRAYWSLVLAQADVKIKRRSVARAQKQYDDTAENIKRELLADAEIYLVQESLNLFKQNLLRSKESLRLAQIDLARLLQIKKTSSLIATQALVVPDETLSTRYGRLSSSMIKAHPVMKAARLTLKQSAIQHAFESNQIAPSLDVVGQVDLNGQGDSSASAWVESFSASLPDFSVGVVFQMPLVRDPDYARVEQALLRKRQNKARLKRARQSIVFDVKEVMAQLKTRRAVLALATKRVRLARLKLETEQEKYKRGYSSLDRIVRFQRDVDSAFIAQQRLIVDLLTLNSQLAQRAGQLHVQLKIKVDG